MYEKYKCWYQWEGIIRLGKRRRLRTTDIFTLFHLEQSPQIDDDEPDEEGVGKWAGRRGGTESIKRPRCSWIQEYLGTPVDPAVYPEKTFRRRFGVPRVLFSTLRVYFQLFRKMCWNDTRLFMRLVRLLKISWRKLNYSKAKQDSIYLWDSSTA